MDPLKQISERKAIRSGRYVNHGLRTVDPLKHFHGSGIDGGGEVNHGLRTVDPLKLKGLPLPCNVIKHVNHGLRTVDPLKGRFSAPES